MQEKPKKNYLRRFVKQLLVSGLIFAVFMVPDVIDNPSLKDLQSKAKNIVFYQINPKDVTDAIKEAFGKITQSHGETQNEDSDQSYPNT